MLDFRDYFLNNEDEMEALITDYLRKQKKNREQKRTQSVEFTAGKFWPFYRNVDIPGFIARRGSETRLDELKTGIERIIGSAVDEELRGGQELSPGTLTERLVREVMDFLSGYASL